MSRAAKAVDGKHNLEVIGSNPVPATNKNRQSRKGLSIFIVIEKQDLKGAPFIKCDLMGAFYGAGGRPESRESGTEAPNPVPATIKKHSVERLGAF